MTIPLPLLPFYFLRHGVTDHNQRRLVMGQLDIPLNDLGRQQAHRAAVLVAGLGIGQVVSSPLVRARETAEIIAETLHLSVTVLDGLRERDWGEMSGRTYRELMQAQYTPRGAESLEDFSLRILGALRLVSLGGPSLLVAHSGMCRVLRRHLSIADDRKPIPNAVPILFAPDPTGRWTERAIPPQGPGEAASELPYPGGDVSGAGAKFVSGLGGG